MTFKKQRSLRDYIEKRAEEERCKNGFKLTGKHPEQLAREELEEEIINAYREGSIFDFETFRGEYLRNLIKKED